MIPVLDLLDRMQLTAEAIAICNAYGVSLEDASGPSRVHSAVMARHRIWFQLREKAGMSYSAIGRAFKRDHTSVMHAVRGWSRSQSDRAIAGLE